MTEQKFQCQNCDLCFKSVKHEKANELFPVNNNKRLLRNSEAFKVKFAKTKRYMNSAIPYMQNLLNEDEETKRIFKRSCGLV